MNDSNRPPTTADLLAHRDGELLDVELQNRIRNDLSSSLRVRRLELMRQDLESLPDIEPDADLWARIQAQADGTVTRLPERRTPAWKLRYPLATAATVFFAVLAASIVLGPGFSPTEPAGPQLAGGGLNGTSGLEAQPRDSLTTLVDRSQAL